MKIFIPKIAKIIRARPQIIVTLLSSGIALKMEFTANFNPSFLLIILKGLNARSALILLIAFKPFAAFPKDKLSQAVITTTKSKIFQPTFKYGGWNVQFGS